MTTYVPFDRDQPFLLPPDLRDWLPEDDIAHFIAEARRLVEAGHAVPGPDARDKWNDMRLAHPADLSPYLQRKQEAYDALSDELSRLWGRP